MKEYYYLHFQKNLAKIKFSKPNQVLLDEVFASESVAFFGGKDWNNVEQDLASISVEEKELFVLSLFMTTLTDQCLYHYFKEVYEKWRTNTNFPKFGWTGLGIHNENPFKLLYAAEKSKCLDIAKTKSMLSDFVNFYLTETETMLAKYSNVGLEEYINCILTDSAYKYEEGDLVPAFKSELEKQSNNQR